MTPEQTEARREKARIRASKWYYANKGKAHDYYEANRERINEQRKEKRMLYYQANKGRIQQYQAERYERNKDEILIQAKAYREAHPQEVADAKRKCHLAKPHLKLEAEQSRRARKHGTFKERVFRSVLFKRDHGVCHLCNLPVDPNNWHLDHIMPFAHGGEHSYANTAVSHPFCNLSKGAKILTMEES